MRLLYYKSLSETVEESVRQSIQYELLEEFGPFPEELKQLFFLLQIREWCKKLLIRDVKISKRALSLTFHEKSPVSYQKILKVLENSKGLETGPLNFKIPYQSENLMEETGQVFKTLF